MTKQQGVAALMVLTDDEARLADLIARVEKATGPDREIDSAIKVLSDPDRYDTSRISGTPGWVFDKLSIGHSEAPRYTTSLDAVVALVEREFQNYYEICRLTRSVYTALIATAEPCEGDYVELRRHRGKAATPALALLLAFLRAKEKSR